jgi:uncharacterized protein (TIGR02118 family)
MVKLVFCVTRRPDMPVDEFHRYWEEQHGPLVRTVASTLGIRRYVQDHTLSGAVGDMLTASRGGPGPFDGIAELWFDSEEALVAASSSPEGLEAGTRLLEDERRFIDHERSPLFLVSEVTVV